MLKGILMAAKIEDKYNRCVTNKGKAKYCQMVQDIQPEHRPKKRMDNQTKELYQWVKASEVKYLPMEKCIHILDNTGTKRLGNFYENETGLIEIYIAPNGAHGGFTIKNEHLDHYSILIPVFPSPAHTQVTDTGILDKFIEAIKDEFKDENWDYLQFIADRVRNNNTPTDTPKG